MLDRYKEGEHYIFDYYAMLGLEPTADDQAIRAAIKTIVVQNHPDKFREGAGGYDKDVLAAASRKMDMANRCEEILCNPEKKSPYDARLAWFREHHPKAISSNYGTIVINLDVPVVDVEQLLSGAVPDQSGANRILGTYEVTQRSIDRARRDYAENPDDPVARAELNEILHKRFAVLEGREELAWQAAGVHGNMAPKMGKVGIIGNYAEHVADMIADVAENRVGEAIQTKAAGLLSGLAPPLLLTDQRSGDGEASREIARLDDHDISMITAQAQEAFLRRTARIKELAREKQQILHELFSLLSTEEVITETGSDKTEIVLMQRPEDGGEAVVILSVIASVRDKEIVLTDGSEGLEGKTVAQMKELPVGHDVLAVEFDPELSRFLYEQMTYCYQKHKGEELGVPLNRGEEKARG